MGSLNPTSVNTLRFVTISSWRKPFTENGDHVRLIGITLKTGGPGAIVDNLHAGGGVVAGVNLETGVVETDGVNWQGEPLRYHPVTGVEMKGFSIPYFEETKQFVFSMIEDLQLNGMIGWDIAIGETGPLLIEPNGLPDLVLLSLPYVPEHIGLKGRVEPLLRSR